MRRPRKVSKCLVDGLAALCALALNATISAHAGTVEGTISHLYQRSSDGLVILYVSGTASGRPTCAASTVYWIVKDENSSAGKGHFAMLLAAKIAGKSVRIVGANTCVRWGDGEDINYVEVLD
jgi:hypothetical protein